MASTSPSPGDATAPPAAAAPPAASVPPQATATGDIASPKAPAATTANASPVADTNAVGNGTPAVNRALDTSFKDAEKAEIQPNSPQGDAHTMGLLFGTDFDSAGFTSPFSSIVAAPKVMTPPATGTTAPTAASITSTAPPPDASDSLKLIYAALTQKSRSDPNRDIKSQYDVLKVIDERCNKPLSNFEWVKGPLKANSPKAANLLVSLCEALRWAMSADAPWANLLRVRSTSTKRLIDLPSAPFAITLSDAEKMATDRFLHIYH